MPVRSNGYYSDPALASSFDNLAAAFAGPTGTDTAGFAKARATQEAAARLSDMYNYAKNPGYDQTTADRMGVASGNYAPNQSYYAVDENNDSTKRGQDIGAKSALDVANVNNAGALARTYAAPVILSDGQTANLPAQTQAATGLPGMFRGNITTAPGQTVTTPGGQVVAGPAKPLTDAEVKGAILGQQSPADQRAVAMQGVGVTQVLDKKGEPTIVNTPDAAGRTPYAADTRQPQIANYSFGGKKGTAVLDKDTLKWKDTQSGEELPAEAGLQTYSASLQGGKDDTGLGASTKNNIDQQLVDLALTEQTSKQLRNIVSKNPAVQGLAGNIRGTVQDVIQAGGEVGQLFNVNMEKIKKDITDGRVDPEVAKKFTNFDPNIPATSMLETLLTAQVAKVLDPNGRISNDRYKQVEKALGAGGLLGNTAKTTATLDQLDKIMADRRSILSPVAPAAAKIGQAPGTAVAAPAATPAASAPEVWERGPDGQLRRAQ